MFDQLDHSTRHDALRVLRNLPQVMGGVVPEDRIGRWLDFVARTDPSRICWHLRRLGGIGGSEIASVMMEPGAYNTPRGIAMSKLMITPPMRPTAAMKRGAMAEDFIRDMFETSRDDSEVNADSRASRMGDVMEKIFISEMNSKFGVGRWRRRGDLEHRIQNARHEATSLPCWMIGSPDAVYSVDINGHELTFPLDFKAPGEDGARAIKAKKDHAGPWRLQVQEYGAIMDGLGTMPDACVLAIFDYHNAGTAPFIMIEDAPDPDIWMRMRDVGDHFWSEYVLRGELPAAPPRIEIEPPVEVEEASRRWVAAKAVLKAAEADLNESEQVIKSWAARHSLPTGTLAIGNIQGTPLGRLRVKEKFNAEVALLRMIDSGKITLPAAMELYDGTAPMPPTDSRYQIHIKDAEALIQTALDQIMQSPEIGDQSNLADKLSAALTNLRPTVPGPLKTPAVKELMAAVGEEPDLYTSREFVLAKSETKNDIGIYRQILNPAQQAVSGYVTDVLAALPPGSAIERPAPRVRGRGKNQAPEITEQV